MRRRPGSAVALAVLAAALFSLGGAPRPGFAAEAMQIKGLHLGMSLTEGEIEGVYQSALGDQIEDSVGLTVPYDHVETKLLDGSRLSLHFTAAEDGAELFWIRLSTSWLWPVERPAPALADVLADIEKRFGAPSRSAGPRDGAGDLLLVFATPGTSADLPDPLAVPPEEIGGVQFLSYRQRVALFGRQFHGAVITIVTREGKVVAMVEELADHPAGAGVLVPGK